MHIIEWLKEIVSKKKPTVFILQEFEFNNSKEPMDYIKWMKEKGYTVKGVMPDYKVSMTLFFVKGEFSDIGIIHPKTGLTARDYAIKIEDYIIYGTHVPLNSANRPNLREDYWEEIIDFYNSYKEDKLILLGDFNTYIESEAYRCYQALLECGAYDLWLRQGKSNLTPTELKHRGCLDYIFISPSAEEGVVSMDIDLDTMDKDKISDHAAFDFAKVNKVSVIEAGMYGLSIFTLFRNVIVMLLHLESHFKINARQKDLISEAS